MRTVVETYIAIFIICIGVLLGGYLIAADLNVADARDAYTTYISQLQDSNFADDVINACVVDAAQRGYLLNIQVNSTSYGDRSGSIELTYNYKIGILKIELPRTIRGYVS